MRAAAFAALQEDPVETDVLSTRQVAQLLGIGEATVKRWADAELLACLRAPGGHRKFRLQDVTSFVQERNGEVTVGLPAARRLTLAGNAADAIVAMERAALDGDAGACIAQLASLRLDGMPLAEIFDAVVTPALSRVGSKRARRQLSVADEEVATNTILDVISRAQPLAEPPGEPVRADRGSAVVASVSGEGHDVAARMVSCLLRARGFEVLAPLADTCARELAELIVRARAQVVCLSATTTIDPGRVQEQVELATEAVLETGGMVFCQGPGFAKLKLPAGVRLTKKLTDLSVSADVRSRTASAKGQRGRGQPSFAREHRRSAETVRPVRR